MAKSKWWLGALVATLASGAALTASAQDAPKAKGAEAAPQEDGAAEEEESRHPMAWIGLGVSVGAGGVGAGSFQTDNPAYDPSGAAGELGIDTGFDACPINSPQCEVSTDARAGFQLTLKITMGGDGFGWDFDPYMNFASGATAMGMYSGPKFDIHVIDPLYIGFGFGVKGAWVDSKSFDYAADLYGRVPLRATYYLLNDLGLVAEVGLGYGLSGYVSTPKTMTDGSKSDTKVDFGSAMTWDFSVGTRWP